MNDFFAAVDSEKQQRIINAALREFALHGFKKASTNRIVETAGIGKGMLFYYFHSKQELYEFLLEHSMEIVKKYFRILENSENNRDFIDKCRIASKIKLEMYLENPHVTDFLTSLYLHPEEAYLNDILKKRFEELNTIRREYLDQFISTQDLTGLRQDIPAEKLVKYVKWLMDGYIQDITSRLDPNKLISEIDQSTYWAEFDELLDDLKTLFYEIRKSSYTKESNKS